MERQIIWSPWSELGLEHLHLLQQPEHIVADGIILAMREQRPFRVHYEIHCTLDWQLRSVHVSLLADRSQSLHLLTDGKGNWTTPHGEALPLLQGCLDVDISGTPFTNTLPIRRLALQPGCQATLSMVYIVVPQMHIEITIQRYTCLDATPLGGRYLFESLKDGMTLFQAELSVDQDGLVIEYPGIFRRIS